MKKKKYNQLKADVLKAVAGGVLDYNMDDVIKTRKYAQKLWQNGEKENDDMLKRQARRFFKKANDMEAALAKEQGWELVNKNDCK